MVYTFGACMVMSLLLVTVNYTHINDGAPEEEVFILKLGNRIW
jgi:hypothetical protein